jgi:hypothetical protein
MFLIETLRMRRQLGWSKIWEDGRRINADAYLPDNSDRFDSENCLAS